jgi:hypothetical protein
MNHVKLIFISAFISLFFLSCQNDKNRNESKNEKISNNDLTNSINKQFKEISYSYKINNLSQEDDSLYLNINITKPQIIDNIHIGYVLVYSLINIPNDIQFVMYDVNIKDSLGVGVETLNYRFPKEKLKYIKNQFQDYGYKNLILTSLKTFNEYDAPIFDMYSQMIYKDFLDIKLDLKSFDLISEFHSECLRYPKNEFGKAGRTLLLIYDVDKELDILKNGNQMSKKVKTIWESSILKTDIEHSLSKLLN